MYFNIYFYKNFFLLGVVWFVCRNGCGKKYKHRTNLLRHTKNECGVEPQFKCPCCPKAYTQNASLKFHMLRQHTAEIPTLHISNRSHNN